MDKVLTSKVSGLTATRFPKRGRPNRRCQKMSTFDLSNANKSKVAIVGLTHSQFAEMLLLKNVQK